MMSVRGTVFLTVLVLVGCQSQRTPEGHVVPETSDGAEGGESSTHPGSTTSNDSDGTTGGGLDGTSTASETPSGSDDGGPSGESTDESAGDTDAEHVVPVLVLLSDGGRTLTSCDDGNSWAYEHFFEEGATDHSPFTAKGLVSGNGRFVAGAGWGHPSRILVSSNGVDWTDVPDEDFLALNGQTGRPSHGNNGVAFDGEVFVAIMSERPWVSEDGEHWTQVSDEPVTDEIGRAVGGGSGRIFVSDGASTLRMSADQGQTWLTAAPFSGACGSRVRAIETAPTDRVLVAGRDGTPCASTDGGESFSAGPQFTTRLETFFARGEEWISFARSSYSAGTFVTYSSEDGLEWTESDTELPQRFLAATVTPSGALVGIGEDNTSIYRSADGGESWALATSDGERSDYTRVIASGFLPATEACVHQ